MLLLRFRFWSYYFILNSIKPSFNLCIVSLQNYLHKTDFSFFNLTALYYTFNVRDKMKKMWGQNHVKKILDHLFGILPKTSVQIVKAS